MTLVVKELTSIVKELTSIAFSIFKVSNLCINSM